MFGNWMRYEYKLLPEIMDTSKKNIDPIFIERSNTHRQAPRRSLFDEISSELDRNKQAKDRSVGIKKLRPILSIAASLVIIVAAFFAIQVYQNSDNNYNVAELNVSNAMGDSYVSTTQLYSVYKISDHKAWLREYEQKKSENAHVN